MELLLNPNVGYLLMMGGILLGLLALLTPGTGILELGAALVLVVVGIELFNLPVNLWAFIPILLGAGLYVLAIVRKGDPVLLGVALAIILIGSALLFRGENGLLGVDPWLILVVSVVEGAFLWVVSRKVVSASSIPPRQDINTLIGRKGETRTQVHGEGTVYADGEEWSARSSDPIPPNTLVRVVGRDGFVLLVAPLTPPSTNGSGKDNEVHIDPSSGG